MTKHTKKSSLVDMVKESKRCEILELEAELKRLKAADAPLWDILPFARRLKIIRKELNND